MSILRLMFKNKLKGYFLPVVLAFAVMAFIIGTAITSMAISNFNLVRKQSRSTSALNIADAGINYYLWHLSHNNQDYCDGNPCSGSGPFGPFTHEYKDSSGNVVGSFILTITPPSGLAGAVSVRSEGISSTGEKRNVVSTLGIPSFAQYSFVTNSEVWFGDSEQTIGLVHSNNGIHYDGVANGIVSSAVETYKPAYCFGGDGYTHPGIWGSGGPTSYWQFPVPPIDFNQITSDLNDLRDAAIDDGIYIQVIPGTERNKRSKGGYVIQIKPSSIKVGQVTASTDSGGSGGSCSYHPSYKSIMQTVNWESTDRALPDNGIIFVEDNVWVYGNVNSRLTIASARFPENSATYANIFIQNDILYSDKSGAYALGLISQSDLVVNKNSEDDLEINAYLLSQKGHVFRPCYSGSSNCRSPFNNVKTRIYIYGGVGSNSWWTWSWVDSSGTTVSGYRTTVQQYDDHLALNPPPLFPTTGSYAILSWKEEPIL